MNDISNTPLAELITAVQTIIKGKLGEDVLANDVEVAKVITMGNMELEALQLIADWRYLRQDTVFVGEALANKQVYELDSSVYKISTEENDVINIIDPETSLIISQWGIASPSDLVPKGTSDANISKSLFRTDDNRAAFINGKLIFSRPFLNDEIGGAIEAPVYNKFTKLSVENATNPIQVRPMALFAYGIAKRLVPSDLVRANEYPVLVQEYNDLLQNALDENEAANIISSVVVQTSAIRGGV